MTTWQAEAAKWLRAEAVAQDGINERFPRHVVCYPEWIWRARTIRQLADALEREAAKAPVDPPDAALRNPAEIFAYITGLPADETMRAMLDRGVDDRKVDAPPGRQVRDAAERLQAWNRPCTFDGLHDRDAFPPIAWPSA